MLKLFLVEDEAIIREGLRDIIPWQQYGYLFVGDAADGEQALPLIRQTKPDVLITDIRMPFMDGLALARLASREFPNMKIIIISGYDDFEYARQALRIGVEQYLLKPITKTMLIRTLVEVQEKIQSEREQKDYLEKFRSEMQEYEQFARRRFFEDLVAGRLGEEEARSEARRLNLGLDAPWYNLVLFSLQAKEAASGEAERTLEALRQAEEELLGTLGRSERLLVFRWNLTMYAILICGERSDVEADTERCVRAFEEQMAGIPEEAAEWHLAAGEPVARLKELPLCFSGCSHLLSYRHLLPGRHVLTRETVRGEQMKAEEPSLRNLDMTKIDPGILRGFLMNGMSAEVEEFAGEYVDSLKDAVHSRLFCQYLMLNVRFGAIAYVEELGYPQEEFLAGLPWEMGLLGQAVSRDELKEYIRAVLARALEFREKESRSRRQDLVGQAVQYIDRHYADDAISLGDVACHLKVSANYFSAVFSQEMQQTFVEYLTQKRMEKAKELLRGTDQRTAEIAGAVGYRDPHYFSFVFRKTQGCTPRDYRAGGRR